MPCRLLRVDNSVRVTIWKLDATYEGVYVC